MALVYGCGYEAGTARVVAYYWSLIQCNELKPDLLRFVLQKNIRAGCCNEQRKIQGPAVNTHNRKLDRCSLGAAIRTRFDHTQPPASIGLPAPPTSAAQAPPPSPSQTPASTPNSHSPPIDTPPHSNPLTAASAHCPPARHSTDPSPFPTCRLGPLC